MTTALIAEDEPLMAARLAKLLAKLWPELRVVATASDGESALELIRQHKPNVAFLDIQMPVLTGLEVAARCDPATHVVFVTAYDQYAIAAFERGAVDYVLKPAEEARLIETIGRLKARLGTPPADIAGLLKSLLDQRATAPTARSKWLRASLGNTTRLINIDEVLFFQSDTKYTRAVLAESEALLRTSLKELLADLDPEVFWQVHRGTIVNAHAIDRAVREGPELLVIHLKNHRDTLRVSRHYFHLFKQV